MVHRMRGLLAIVMLLSMVAVFSRPAQAQDQTAYTLRILHTNDHHSHLEPVTVGDKKLGGVARRATLINQIRAEGGNTLLVDGGDVFQGTLFFNKYEGQADLYFYNALGYEGMAVGNHEFDKGQQVLANFAKGANFPLLSANTVIDPSSPLYGLIQGYVGKEIGGQKVGIIGLTTEETSILSSPGPGVQFSPHIDAVRMVIDELKKAGVNKIIVLSHLGLPVEREMARSVSGIDVIVGGHTHSPLGPMPGAVAEYPILEKDPDGHTTVVVTDWEWGKYLGDVTVNFDADGNIVSAAGQPHAVDESITPDPTIDAKVQEYAAPLNELRSEVIGTSTVELNGARTDVRSKETNLGDYIADVVLNRTRADGGQVAIMNGGGIRASIPAGQVTVGQVLEVLPFGNTIALVTINGAQLKTALENGVSQVEEGAGRFPQIAGMRFSYDPTQAAGSRVTQVQVWQNGQYVNVDPNASYRVATNNFMVAGGDGYAAFTEGSNVVDTGYLLADEVINAIRAAGTISPATEGRIVVGQSVDGGAAQPTPAPEATPTPQVPGQLPDTGIPASLPNTGASSSSALWVLLVGALLLMAVGAFVARRRIA